MAKSTPSHAAKHAFLYLTSFATLALVAINLGIICFQLINYYFPEELQSWNFDFSNSALKFAIASVLIATPVFYFVTHNINRNISKKDLDEDSGIRRWLTYIVMFFAVGTVIGDLIAAVYSFLEGELSIRFLLKVLTILVIAGGIFLYYFMDMKNKTQKSRNEKNKIWGMVFWLLVLIPFVWSFFLAENPQTTRLRRLDNQTIRTLENMTYQVHDFYSLNERVPNSLEEMNSTSYYLPTQNERAEKNITYTATGETTYQLCADFERDNTEDTNDRYSYEENWKHSAGNHCFDLESTNPNGIVPTPVRY